MTGSWAPAVAPTSDAPEVVGTSPVRVVDDALVTPVELGPLHAADVTATRWMRGAVHDRAGRLVPESVRPWRSDPNAAVAADPLRVPVPDAARELSGEWVYGGHWTGHFGHFLVEVLPVLHLPAYDGARLLFHRSFRFRRDPDDDRVLGLMKPVVQPWQRDLLELAGFTGARARTVNDLPVRVASLTVPARPVVLKHAVGPSAVEVWRRVAGAVPPGDARRVFLSRRLHHAAQGAGSRSSAEWDEHLDRAFDDAGFTVVHPEQLPLREQVALVGGAEALAASAGSALHLSVFARPGTRVLEVGDRRSPTTPLPTQRAVDAACGHLTRFVPYGDRAALAAALADVG